MHSVIQLLKRIFTMQTIGLMVGIGSLLVAVHQVLSDSDGEPVVSWNGAEMAPNSKVTTYVYTSTSESIPIAPLLATIENPTQHTAQDVSAKYCARVQGLTPEYSFDYRTQMGMQGVDIRNVESSLPAFEQMSAPINYVELEGKQGELTLSLRLTYNGIDTPFQASQRVVFRRFKSALYDNAVKDARKCAMGADDAIYVYMPQNGFMPLVIPAVEQTTTPAKQTSTVAQNKQQTTNKQSVKQTPAQTEKHSVKQTTTQTAKKQTTTVKSTKKKRSKAYSWILTIGLIILCSSLAILVAILYEPSEAAYDLILEQICDGFKINLREVKRAFDLRFWSEIENQYNLSAFTKVILYTLCCIIFLIAGVFWLLALLGIPAGIIIAIKEFL